MGLENTCPILLVNVYRPPQGSYNKCCDKLTEAFKTGNLKNDIEIYITGEF